MTQTTQSHRPDSEQNKLDFFTGKISFYFAFY